MTERMERAQAQINEAMLSMAKGATASISAFTLPLALPKRESNRSYFPFNWHPEGSVKVTNLIFGLQVIPTEIVKVGSNVIAKRQAVVTQGLGLFAYFEVSWQPFRSSDSKDDGQIEITMEKFVSVNAQTGQETAAPTGPQRFIVDKQGDFVRVSNLDEIYQFVEKITEQELKAKTEDESEEEREKIIKATKQAIDKEKIRDTITNSARGQWYAWVEMWTHLEKSEGTIKPPEHKGDRNSYGVLCHEFEEKLSRDQDRLKHEATKFLQGMKKSMEETFNEDTNGADKIDIPELKVDRINQSQKYEAVVEAESGRPHQASLLTCTELTLLSNESERFEGAVYKDERWSFAWDNVEGLKGEERLKTFWAKAVEDGNALMAQFQSS